MLWGASTRSSWKTPSRPLTRGLGHRGGVTAQAPPTRLSTGATHPHLSLHLLEGVTEDIPPAQGQDGTSRGQQEGQRVSLEPERDVLAVLALEARSHVAAGEVQGRSRGRWPGQRSFVGPEEQGSVGQVAVPSPLCPLTQDTTHRGQWACKASLGVSGWGWPSSRPVEPAGSGSAGPK